VSSASPAAPALQEPQCPRCRIPAFLPASWSGRARCGGCQLEYEATSFTPRVLAVTTRRIEEMVDAPPCALHAGNAATVTCQRCGTFACDLCRVDQEGMTLCVSCFDRLTAEGALATTRAKERNWGGIASLCVIGSVVGCGIYLGWLLGPIAAWAAWRGLKQRAANGETWGRAGLVTTGVIGLLFAGLSLTVLGIILFGIGSAALGPSPGGAP